MLSDNPRKKQLPSRPVRAVAGKAKSWSDKQKLEAIQTYLAIGNLSMVSQLTGIPYITLKVWKKTEWWNDQVQEIKTSRKIELSAKMKRIIDASLAVVEDRLEHGDYQFDQKTGQNVRKPVNLKDAHRVAVDLQQRQEILEKADVAEVHEEAIENKLLTLANKFAEMATKKIEQKRLDENTIEAEDVQVKE